MEFKKFPKIGQFNSVVREVRQRHDFQGFDDEGNAIIRHDSPYPTIEFIGSVKLHGTNAAIVMCKGEIIGVQSRTRELSIQSDNAGFAQFVNDLPSSAKAALDQAIEWDDESTYYIYGEWCGGNIQKGVAINQLAKMFVVFAVKKVSAEVEEWQLFVPMNAQALSDGQIFDIDRFQLFNIRIDFNRPELAQPELERITSMVEKECPVGKAFGVSGVGEGVVWEGISAGNTLRFKVKGEKHSATKVKTLAPVDIEKVASVNAFVERTVTENRLNQGLDYLREQGLEIDPKNTGVFLKWVGQDIFSEEMDCLTESGLERKDVGGEIAKAAKVFWWQRINAIE